MFQRILVVLDGSKQAESVLGRTATLAARHNAEVILLMVLRMPTMIVEDGSVISTIDEEVEQERALVQPYLAKWKERFAEGGIKTSTAIRFGDAVQQIADYAKGHDVDLIVVPEKAPKGLEKILHRSLADKVVHTAAAPVLLMEAA